MTALFLLLLLFLFLFLLLRITSSQQLMKKEIKNLHEEIEKQQAQIIRFERKLAEDSEPVVNQNNVSTEPPVIAVQPTPETETSPPVLKEEVFEEASSDSATPEPGLAEKLGTMGFVWIGATALALSGIFLVKYSFERGWISPIVRIILAIVFGVALLIAGEWMRSRSSRISEGLSAAGIADLYASFLAAYYVYHLVPVIIAFLFLTLITALAVLLSLRQGQLIAVLGVMGGFFTPSWIHTAEPNPVPLFSYLMLLQFGLLVITRKKRWNVLTVLTLLGSIVWVIVWLIAFYQPTHILSLSLFLLATAGLFLWRNYLESEDSKTNVAQVLNYASIIATAAIMAMLTGVSGYQISEWLFAGILSAASLTLAAKQDRYFGLACSTLIFTAILLLVWSFAPSLPLPRFRITVALEILLYAGAAYWFVWRTESDSKWAVFSISSALILFLIGYRAEPQDSNFHWSIASILLAAIYFAGAIQVRMRAAGLNSAHSTLAAMAIAVTAFVTLSIPMELHERWIVVPMAMEIAALAAISRKLKIAALDSIAGILMAIVLLLLMLRIGVKPSWYWILYSYGLSAGSLALAARFAVRKDHSNVYQWCSLFLFLVLLTFEAGQIHHPGIFEFGKSWKEIGTLAIAWLLYAFSFLTVGIRWNLKIPVRAARVVTFLAAAEILLFACAFLNPLFNHVDVGQTFLFNHLLYVYGMPALLFWVIAGHRSVRDHVSSALLKGIALMLVFLLLNFEIRQTFQGNFLDADSVSSTEQYAYSVFWIVFGIVLTVLATIKRGALLRYGSLVILLMAVFKVFLYDSAKLTDLYRVLSFLGLGITLLVIAYLHQRVLFRIPEEK